MRVLALPPVPPRLFDVLADLERARRAVLVAAPDPDAPGGSLPPADVVLASATRSAAVLARRGATSGPLVAVWGDAAEAVAALDAGADLWLDPGESPAHLAARIGALVRRSARTGTARVDPGTGLMDRGMFEDLLAHEFERAARYRRAVGLVMVEPDGLESCGPEDLERTRAELGTRLRLMIRDVDSLAAAGGSRFALILPETDAGGAMAAGGRLLSAIAAARVPIAGRRGAVSVSIGLAAYPARAIETSRHLFGRALEALGQARRAGGGRVVAFGATDVIWSREAPDPSTL